MIDLRRGKSARPTRVKIARHENPYEHLAPDERMKVIILSAKGQDSDKQQGKQAGADGYLTKPFSPKQLLEVASRHLG